MYAKQLDIMVWKSLLNLIIAIKTDKNSKENRKKIKKKKKKTNDRYIPALAKYYIHTEYRNNKNKNNDKKDEK